MRISELAKYGLDKRAIDYYTNLGLIPCPEGSKEPSSGYRDYGPEAVIAVKKIAILREAGLPLKRIKEALTNPSYFTTAKWNEHIDELNKKKQESVERYDQMIEYAEALRDSRSIIFHFLDNIKDVGDGRKLSKLFSLIMSRLEALMRKGADIIDQAYDKPDDIVIVYLRVNGLFRTIERLFENHEPYDSEAVQGALSRFSTAIMEAYGVVVYCIFDAFKDVDKAEFGFFDDISEDDYRILTHGLAVCFDWYRKARTIKNALDNGNFQTVFSCQIHEYDELVGESTVDGLLFLIRLISYIPTLILGLVKDTDKDETSVKRFSQSFEIGASSVATSSCMTYEQRNSIRELIEYMKNAVVFFLKEKAKALPEDWLDTLNLEFEDK